jgi:hypothetical protein
MPALQGSIGHADLRNVVDLRRTDDRATESSASPMPGRRPEDISSGSPSNGPDPVGARATWDTLSAPQPTLEAEPTIAPVGQKKAGLRVLVATLVAFSMALGAVFLLLLGGGHAKTTAGARSATSAEETTCNDPGAILGSHPTAEGVLQTDLIHALPCAFSSTAWEPAGSTNFVVYLAPLNEHTRSVAEAIIAKDPVPGLASITLKQGAQSYSRGQEQMAAILTIIPPHARAPISLDRYGVVTVEIYGHPVSDASIIAASHVPGYQAEPLIVHVKKPIMFCPGSPGCPSEAIQ